MEQYEHPVFNPEAMKRLVKAGEELQEAARKAMTRLNDRLRMARLAREEALRQRNAQAAAVRAFLETPPVRELRSAAVFHLAIIRERQTGLAYVKALGDQARADLGLRPEHDPNRYQGITIYTDEEN